MSQSKDVEKKQPDGHQLHEHEKVQVRIRGRNRAVIKKKMPDGSIQVTELPWGDNRVVDGAGPLIAGLLKKDSGYTDWGFLQYAIGEGNAAWDAGSPPTPSMSQSTLLAEFDRKAPDYVIYMDPNPTPPPDYLPASGQTNIIETRVTFTFADGPSPGKWIREQALFGGDATSTPDSGNIFNVYNHVKVWKDDTIEIEFFFVHEIDIVAL